MLSLAFPFLLLLCHLLVSAFFAFFSLCLRYNATDFLLQLNPTCLFLLPLSLPLPLPLCFFFFHSKKRRSRARCELVFARALCKILIKMLFVELFFQKKK